ncbi:MAG: precorrin-4 C(11)-methyltransferase [Prevotella sp.]|nr:precorrin-4 C(11)-methyltransferase [Prevotella sp.]
MQKKIAIIQVGKAGASVSALLRAELDAIDIKRADVGACWAQYDAFVFICAMGICVRTIAPYVSDKHTDPAVVCVDALGQHVVSVLSGHVGGANDLAQLVADILQADPVITTQSDLAGLWALDTLGRRFGWDTLSTRMNSCIIHFVNRRPTALFMDVRDEGTDYLESTLPEHVTIVKSLAEAVAGPYGLLIVVSPFDHDKEIVDFSGHLLLYMPRRMITAGFGLAHQARPATTIYEEMMRVVLQSGILSDSIQWCTIDVKADEPFVRLLKRRGQHVRYFTAAELAAVDVPNPSDTVARHVGTPSVSEAAAILGSDHGQLIVSKVKGANWTLALSIDRKYLRPAAAPLVPAAVPAASPAGHIEIVGAGPGDPDLVSVRGRRMLEQADLILYAGSLVPRELTDCHKPGAVVRSSADMALEEQCALMKEHYDQGHLIVRLHTGDPCIFGAIQEQMAFFDREGMSYHITPGISSFLAAAAELRSQFTIPERTQTIILTRGEGRTPMPEREKLHLLARSQSTMCIFLSAAIVDDVQRELLQEYPEDTPVAACYHLTWPDQRIYRGQLKDLARIVHDNHLTLTTMLVVGEAIDNRRGLSELYNRHFTHLFRKGDE